MARRGRVPFYLTLDAPPMDILDNALCRPEDALLFDGRDSESGGTAKQRKLQQTRAQRICNGHGRIPECPVRDQCFQWALDHGGLGIYGGRLITHRVLAAYRRYIAIKNLRQTKETA